MRIVQTLRTSSFLIALLFSIFYIVSFIIPANHEAEQLDTIKPLNISGCLCSPPIMHPISMAQLTKTRSPLKRLNSSCSDERTHYHTDQNVISFSMFYSQKPSNKTSWQVSPLNYKLGLDQNLLMMREHYPGYSIRIYSTVPLEPQGHFCTLLCENKDVFWCDIRKTPDHGDLSCMDSRTWRFLPLGDPTVNVFHSRDLDSLISHREAAAARDWLANSTKAIMVMRDHKVGHNIPILGGMRGANNMRLLGKTDKLRKELISKSQKKNFKGKGKDQKLLNTLIFYPMANDILAYDSNHCVKFSNFTEVRPFPVRLTKPATDFVGNYVKFSVNGTKHSKWKVFECPKKCRPSYGLEWKYC